MALAWSLDDERDDLAAAALEHVEAHGALAPMLWSYEVANVLALLTRRGRLDAERATEIGLALDALRIATVPPDMPKWRAGTMSLAATYDLTVYDASYLRLAVVTGAQLATRDRALQTAARTLGIEFGTANDGADAGKSSERSR
jgi:predicted nucleic acid-binding protein